MNAQSVLEQALELGISVETDGIDLIYWPKGATPPQFVEVLRVNKLSLIEYLCRFQREFPGEEVSDAEYKEMARRVEEEEYALLWSSLLEDFVAFYNTDSDRAKIPAGFVPYIDSELQELFREDSPGWSIEGLRLIHAAKKLAGFKVTEVHD